MDGSQVFDIVFTLGKPSVPRTLTRALRLRTLGAVLAIFALFITWVWVTNSMTVVNDVISNPSLPHLLYNTFPDSFPVRRFWPGPPPSPSSLPSNPHISVLTLSF